jgi:hypothetical protein
MSAPFVAAWVEQRDNLPCFGIDPGNVRPFVIVVEIADIVSPLSRESTLLGLDQTISERA